MTREVVTSSRLAAPRSEVWARVASFAGINDELRPLMRMTAPRGVELTPAAVPVGERWFRSWILLGGLIPFDYDDLCVVRLDEGSGFHERSAMLSAPVWEHERTLSDLPEGGTRLTDRVTFEPRLAFGAPVHRAIIAAVFRHRHRRLARHFGVAP